MLYAKYCSLFFLYIISSERINVMCKKTPVLFISVLLGFIFFVPVWVIAQVTWTQYTYENTNGKLGSNMIYAIAPDPNDNGRTIWFGCRDSDDHSYEGGLSKFDTQTKVWNLYTTDNSGLPNNRIWDIEFDAQGNMWIGTHGGGLAKFDGVDNWTVYDEDNSPLGYNFVYEIEIDKQGILWIGHGEPGDVSGDAAITIFDRDSQWHVFTAAATPLEENTCYAITFGLDGLRWFGQKNTGIFSLDDNGTPFNPDDDEWTHYTTFEGLERNTINAGTGDTNINGDIWFGHGRGGGTDDYDPGCARYTNSEWVNYLADEARIRTIDHDAKGNVWLGDKGGDSDSKGLYKFDGTNWQNWETENSDIPWDWINKIVIERENDIMWIGFNGDYYEGGVAKVEGLVTSIENNNNILPPTFYLKQNYPNPFNPETVIEFSLNKTQHIKLAVYNVTGQLIRVMENTLKSSGNHKVHWDGRDDKGRLVSSGIYYYILETDLGLSQTKKAILIR